MVFYSFVYSFFFSLCCFISNYFVICDFTTQERVQMGLLQALNNSNSFNSKSPIFYPDDFVVVVNVHLRLGSETGPILWPGLV